MIYFDRLLRFIRGDMFLPNICYVDCKMQFNKNLNCACKSFCRQLPSNGKVSIVYVKHKQ